MTRRTLLALALSVSLAALAAPAQAENWPHWRGPAYNGSSPETNLPTTWSKTDNIKWSVDLPGQGASTPIIWGDRVFVSSVYDSTEQLVSMCFDRTSGKLLWSDEVGKGTPQDNRSNMAAPSPVTDGKHVVYFYSTGDMVGYTVDGKRLWHRDLTEEYAEFSFQWTFSSSPTLHDGKLYMQVLQRDQPVHGRGKRGAESYLFAADPATGKNIWRVVRPSNAQAESLEAFSTLIPHTHAGREELLVAGGDALTGHDPDTGKELWRWGTWNPTRIGHWRLVPSPVTGGGVILACAPKGDPIYAVRAGGKGDISDSGLVWKSEDRAVSSDVCTPLFYQGKFFVLNGERQQLSCVEPATGKVLWQTERGQLGKDRFRASPTGADGKLYCMNHAGEVFVFNAANGEQLAQIAMGEQGTDHARPSIAVSQGNLFIKVAKKLYCVGK